MYYQMLLVIAQNLDGLLIIVISSKRKKSERLSVFPSGTEMSFRVTKQLQTTLHMFLRFLQHYPRQACWEVI